MLVSTDEVLILTKWQSINMNWFNRFFAIGLLLIPMILDAQISQVNASAGDSAKTLRIPLEEIPLISLQTTIKLDKIAESLITEDQLANEKTIGDSILANIETFLSAEENIDFESLLSRTLVNKSNFWNGYKEVLSKQADITENIITELTSNSKEINNELKLWENTQSMMDSDYTDSLYSWTIREVILHADSLGRIILARKTVCFALLKKYKSILCQSR